MAPSESEERREIRLTLSARLHAVRIPFTITGGSPSTQAEKDRTPFYKEPYVHLRTHCNNIVLLLCFSDELIANGEAGTFDMVYIDADKWNYTVYYDKCVELVRKGGLILLDDVNIVCVKM